MKRILKIATLLGVFLLVFLGHRLFVLIGKEGSGYNIEFPKIIREARADFPHSGQGSGMDCDGSAAACDDHALV